MQSAQLAVRENTPAASRSAMSVKSFCEAYDVGETTVYRLMASGNLRAVKVGRKTLIPMEAARDWLKSLPAAELTTGLNAPQSVPA